MKLARNSSIGLSDSKAVTITADSTFRDPATLKFAHVKDVLQNGSTCTTCHLETALPQPAATPPIWYRSFDRNFSGAVDATDDDWFYSEIMGRVNLTEISDSSLLRKPSEPVGLTGGNHHNGGTLFDLATAAGLLNYSIIYNWILAGAPAGGVAANSGASSSNAVTFSGSPLTAGIALDGTKSLGPTGATLTYSWSVSGPNGPTGATPSITNPTSALATLNVTNIGTYVAQLQVSDGTSTDSAQRTITVTENPITAIFSPATGSTAVPFSGSPVTGNITLHSTSTGVPTTCQWQVSGSAGWKLDNILNLATLTKACGTDAILNVPFSAVNSTYVVTLTASNISSSSVTNNINVTNGTPVVAAIVVNSGTTPVVTSFSGGNPATGAASTATVSLSSTGSAGVLPLTYSWSIFSEPDATNGAASLSSVTAAAPTLTVKATGSYTVRLDVTDAALNTTFTTSMFSVTPTSGTTFSTMTTILGGCTVCHTTVGGNPANNSGTAPDWENEVTAGTTLWRRVFQRVNLGTSTNSLLLLNPSNDQGTTINTNFHGGGCRAGFNIWGVAAGVISPYFCPDALRANYDAFNSWILDGAPPGN